MSLPRLGFCVAKERHVLLCTMYVVVLLCITYSIYIPLGSIKGNGKSLSQAFYEFIYSFEFLVDDDDKDKGLMVAVVIVLAPVPAQLL